MYQALCTKASKYITRALEEVLEPANTVATNPEEQPTLPSLHANSEEINVQSWMAELDLLNSEVFNNFDITTWTNDLEYDGAIGSWTTF
jgi:hypothetical protein